MAKETEKVLTVVVPTYNMEAYLAKCLDSVTNEYVPSSLEVIVVNDGSKDASLDIMKKYQEKRPDIIKVIDKKNGHYGSCINAGLREATGRYFRPLDADDWFDTDALVHLLKELETATADLVVTLRTEHILTKTGEVKERAYPLSSIEYGRTYDLTDFRFADYAVHEDFNMHSMAWRTELLRKSGLQCNEGVCYTDFQYCTAPISHARSFVAYDLFLYHYNIGREGQSVGQAAMQRNFSHIVSVLRSLLEDLEQNASNIPAVFDNQKYFVDKAANTFAVSMRLQMAVTPQVYSDFSYIYTTLERFCINNRLLHKYYFRVWYWLRFRWVIALAMRCYQKAHGVIDWSRQ